MSVTLTPAAQAHVRALRARPDHRGDWLRIGVRGGGCSGMEYVLDWIDAPTDTDKTWEFGPDVKVCVDRKSYLFLVGVTVDHADTLVKSGFSFQNPNAEASCSCGTSFSV